MYSCRGVNNGGSNKNNNNYKKNNSIFEHTMLLRKNCCKFITSLLDEPHSFIQNIHFPLSDETGL